MNHCVHEHFHNWLFYHPCLIGLLARIDITGVTSRPSPGSTFHVVRGIKVDLNCFCRYVYRACGIWGGIKSFDVDTSPTQDIPCQYAFNLGCGEQWYNYKWLHKSKYISSIFIQWIRKSGINSQRHASSKFRYMWQTAVQDQCYGLLWSGSLHVCGSFSWWQQFYWICGNSNNCWWVVNWIKYLPPFTPR